MHSEQLTPENMPKQSRPHHLQKRAKWAIKTRTELIVVTRLRENWRLRAQILENAG